MPLAHAVSRRGRDIDCSTYLISVTRAPDSRHVCYERRRRESEKNRQSAVVDAVCIHPADHTGLMGIDWLISIDWSNTINK
jgi:hypothetical protein